MKFLIVIPTHNEQEHILDVLNSLRIQTFQNFNCIIVNDSSTDKTEELVKEFILKINSKDHRFSLKKTPTSQALSLHQPGAKVVRAFNYGLEGINLEDFQVICKFDADILFPNDYLEQLYLTYSLYPKIGMVSGLVYIYKNGKWIFESLSSEQHIRGPIKSYRTSCLQSMGGLRPVLGWDNIDVMLCKMHGYETKVLPNLRVKHLRPTAYKYQSQKAKKLGEYFYNIGLNFPLALIASAKSSFKNASLKEFFITMVTFLKQKKGRCLTLQEIQFIRQFRWQEIKNKVKKNLF